MANLLKKSIFLNFFCQKICIVQKNVLPLHRQFKNNAILLHFATAKSTTKNALTIQKDCKTAAKIMKKNDTCK